MITKKSKVDQDEQVEHHKIKYLEMSDFPPMVHANTREKKIIERKCYVTIYESLMERIKSIFKRDSQANLVVTGNPGIGESRIYLYCIFQLIRYQEIESDVHLVVKFGTEYYKYCFTRKEFFQLNEEEVRTLQQHKKVIRLAEAKSSHLVGWRRVSILFSSPGIAEMNSFIKVHSTKYILPVWSFEEPLEYNSLLDGDLKLSNETLITRYDKFGGVPRLVFEKNGRLNDVELDSATSYFDRFSMACFIDPKKDVREDIYGCWVLQKVPDKSAFQVTYHLDFLSKYIVEQVVEKSNEDDLRLISEFAFIHR